MTAAILLPCLVAVEDVAAIAARQWGEKEVASGVTVGGEKISILINKATGSFTVVLTLPTKAQCILSAGTDFELGAAHGTDHQSLDGGNL